MLLDLVTSALDDLGLCYDVSSDAVCLTFRGQPAAYHVCIREIAQPRLLWLRFTPNIWIDASSSAVLELLAAINHREWLIKCVRNIADGEVYFDVELLLYADIAKETIAEVVVNACTKVTELLPLVLRVQWGGFNPADVLAGSADQSSLPPSRAEQEALEIIEQLESDY